MKVRNVQVQLPPTPINHIKVIISYGFCDMNIYRIQKHTTTKKQHINDEIIKGLKVTRLLDR